MPTKAQAYAQMADYAATQITGSFQDWTAFLATAARLYKYPYAEQLMIYAQKPYATACAEYDFWNDKMRRYVRRGSKGIALINTKGDKPRLKYVFDVSDTGALDNSRNVNLWELQPEHMDSVSAMLERNYDVSGENGLAHQLERVAAQLADEYWNDNQRDILDIVDDSFLYGYDDFSVGVAFRNAATVSITYSLLSRCGLEPENHFEHEDFLSIFDFNTPAAVSVLGTAVSSINQRVLRHIEVTIRNYERERSAERTYEDERIDLHAQRRLSDSRPEPDRATGNEPWQVREDAEEIPSGKPSAAVESSDSLGEAVPAPAGNRTDSAESLGADDAATDEIGGRDRSPESQQPDEVGGADEQLQGAGRGNHSGRADFQLNFFDAPARGEQMTLFPSENEQIAFIQQAESVDKTPFAFSFAQEDIDTVLRLGGNNENSRMRVADEFMVQKPVKKIAAFLSREYVGGGGFKTERGEMAVWFEEDGIHLTSGRMARYSKSAQIVSWNDAAQRIGVLLEQGQFSTNVELAETNGYIRSQLAQSIWYVRHDFDEPAIEQGFLPCLEPMNSGGYPKITAKLADALNNPEFLSTLTVEFAQFLDAYRQDKDLLRFHYHRTGKLLERLHDLALPHREYATELSEFPQAGRFITEDETNAMLAGGSSIEGGKARIYGYFKEPHSLKEQADFLKNEYGIGGHSNALPGCFHSQENHESKGIRVQKPDCYDVQLAWSNVAKRISELIRQERYLTPEEKTEYEELYQEPIPETMQEPPVPPHPILQDDIDDALRAWNGDAASKRAVAQYMAIHARDKDTAAWLAGEYGVADTKFLSITRTDTDEVVELAWSKVQRRIAQLVQTNNFYTDRELDDFAVVESENGWAIWDDLHDGYYVDDEGITEEFDSEWVANDYLFEVREAAAEKEAAEWLKVEQAKAESAEPTAEPSMPDFPYSVGDTVYLEDHKAFIIRKISDSTIQLQDPTLYYPIFRAESRESFARLMERYTQPNRPTSPKPEMAAETVSVYPAEENHLPYDIVIQTLHTEPEHTPEIAAPPENFSIIDDNLGVGGAKAKFRANMDAINTLLQIESENRTATPDEQEVLAKYVGWGGLADAFDETKQNWVNEYKELAAALSSEEYAAARASTLNAHYTSPTVIHAIYEVVGNMGFQTGNILEPAMGVGNFFGCMPEEMRGSKLYGVELDSLTGRIAKQLYPNADITVAGFETTDRRDFYDLAIGNVPFGQYQVNDRAYNKLGFSIHDYFFAKALDQVRPGGVVAFVTSRYTMDKQSPEVRKYIAQRAELLGAIRLPNNAFRANAGTNVVSDIIFLQKRDRPIDIEPDWVHLGQNDGGFGINSYFIDHPEMILGRQTSESTQYGKQDFTVVPFEGLRLADQLADAIKGIRGTYAEAELPELGEDEQIDTAIPADPNVKNYSYTVVDGSVYYRENSHMVKPNLNATAVQRVKGMVELRDCVHKLIDLQMCESGDPLFIVGEQHRLNQLYDDFSAKHGLLNDRVNRLAFSDDSSYYLLCSLEVLDDDGNLERKADMFTKRTIKQHTAVTSVDTASEALAVSIGERARVDLPFMAQLSGKGEEEIIDELTGVIYHDPIRDNWQTSDEYLSGNVRQKLREAQAAAKRDPAYQINVAALEKAQPKDLDASEIEVRLGATWIDKNYIQQFMEETFNPPFYLRRSIQVNYSSYTAEWNIIGKSNVGYGDVAATVTYGTERANAYRILEDSLNLRDIRIYDTVEDPDGKERRVINAKETTLAAQKQQAIRDAFKDWIWCDPHRRSVIVTQYNEEMNSTRPREYDGSHITFSGINPEIQLRDHQKNAVAHVLYGGNTLLAHEVGAGKTFEMVAACMESKRLGLSQKSIFVVPNHLTEQWASEFLRLYPSANLLVTTKKDFETHNRKKFCARIATGDYDAVIIGHSQFERIPISPERQERLLQEQIDEITDGIDEVQSSDGERFTVKQLERTRKGLEARLEKLQASDRKDDVVTFEQLGCDRMFVDESDNYKNLFLYTKMRNVAGLSTTDAQKSSDMFAKCRYLDELTGNRGTVFATGTPISNSMTEMYTIQRYLQYDRLQDMNMTHFDCWASRFGETTTALELAPEGTGYRARTRFAKFFNLPELMNLFREVADIKTADQLNLPTPEVEYHTIASKPTEHQQAMVKALSERAARVHAGSVDPSTDNMLKITSDGRKLGLDQRIINSMLPDVPGTKINQCVENIVQFWHDGEADKLTQLVFCDISTPRATTTARAAMAVSGNLDSTEIHGSETSIDLPEPEAYFTVYEDIRQKLIEKGVLAEQVAFIHDANTDVQKKELFGKVRSGQVRVLIGSTAKMGAGTNVQDRLIASHDLDCPWRPRDLTQRKGRIERQGNQNEKVHVCRYVTEGTFDAYLWQTVENKQKFISQIMSSKSPVRSCDDVDEAALSFAEIKALCAGDPRIKERMDLDVDVSRLKIMKADHQSKQFRLEDNLLKYFPEQIEQNKGFITGLETDMRTLVQHPHPADGFVGMEIRDDVLTDKENAGAALLDACKEVTGLEPVQIGSYRGFSMSVTFDAFEKTFSLTLKGKITHRVDLGKDPRGNLIRIDNALDKMPERLDIVKAKLENLYQQQEAAQTEVGKPFPQEEELKEKSARLIELDIELNMDNRQQAQPENVVAKSARPSVLEKLKAPCVSGTQSRKPQKELEER